MKLRIPHLVVKPGRGGKPRHYWQPSAALRTAGWQPQNLGPDFDAAMKAAIAWNQRVTEWRDGKSAQAPAGGRGQKALLARFARPDTVRELITAFKAERWDHLGAHTRRTYQSALNVIDEWAGDQSPAFITPERCRVLLKALAKPAEPAGPERLHRAAGIGRVLRTVMGWAVDNDRQDRNPMDRVTIREPAPRHQVWPDHAVDAFVEMADTMGEAAIGTALLLAMDTGQREADLLALTWRKLPWIEGRRHIRLQQGKTGVTASVPVHPMWTAEIERLPRRALTLLYDRSGKPFSSTEPLQAALRRLMQHKDVRAAIAEAASRGECDADDSFVWHGLRKNACCYLTELGLSDSQVGGMQGMSTEMVRYYSRRRRTLMLARSGEAAVLGGNVVGLWKGPEATTAAAGGNGA